MLHKYVDNKKIEREYIGKSESWFVEIPSLIEIQLKSYEDFFQKKRLEQGLPLEMKGLHEVFKSVFPIVSEQNDILDYSSYTIDEKGCRYTELECKKRGLSYTIPAKATITLTDDTTGEIKQKDIYIGDIPMITDRGTFIINGSERVVVNQIYKSPGVSFVEDKDTTLMARLIPYRGSWLEFEVDRKKKIINAKIDRKKKILVTTFLKVLGVRSSSDIIELFYDVKKLSVVNLLKNFKKENNDSYILAKNIISEGGEILRRIATPIYQYDLEEFIELNIKEIEVVQFENGNSIENELILNCLLSEEKHLKEGQEELDRVDIVQILYSNANLSDPSNLKNIEDDFGGIFFDEKRYSLGKVGRYKINKKFNYPDDRSSLILEIRDMVDTLKYLIDIYTGKSTLDDVDHLGNRRVRSVGELLSNQVKIALVRIERVAKEKMNVKNIDRSSLRPQDLISLKPVMVAIKEFFTSSQLSQFMDQINPLAEITHKRRLSALGSGGLSRDRAGFEVRGIHYTHYGRICPIETPEGPNIGLIVSLASYAKINEYGFIKAPYRKVINGKVTKDVEYLSAIDEEGYLIAQANAPIDDDGNFLEEQVSSRRSGDYLAGNPNDIDYMDLSSRQIISVSTALIPFLEHDDASRALMGSNMQRQAVPLMFAEPPRVGTGMERMIASNSGVIIKANTDGCVSYVSNSRIDIESTEGIESYELLKYQKTNQESCFNQKPIVNLGQVVKKGEIIADGPSTFNGELALGKNVLVGFVPWNGYGFEDAVLISERISKDDVFTSIHIKELSIDVRDTKLGPEYITRDIPNVSEKIVSHLDERGIVRLGSFVSTNAILVGKVSPKSETENTPEFKLLNQIFGEKAKNIKDSSLRVLHGVEGIVVDVQILKRKDGDELPSTVEERVKIFIASKHKLKEGDKIAGRHGNKGVISKVLPEEDMPFLDDGTPLDICLNPLGVPSRMNIGQILESELGISAMALNKFYKTPVFESASIKQIEEELEKLGFNRDCKFNLRDGKSGELFKNPVFVGCMYIIKLNHLVDHKMHARSTGPYSLITQQPLGGKAQFGGQRLGEMEVWALEAYGAAHTLQEFLTIKSDNIEGRTKIYENIIKGYESAIVSGIPESFNVLVQELRGLGIDLTIYSANNKQVPLTEKDRDLLKKEEENF